MLTIKNITGQGYDGISIVRADNSHNLDIYSGYNGSDDEQTGSFAYGVRPADDAWQIWNRDGYQYGWNNLMTVLKNGNVGIGHTSPSSKLSVNGSIQAQEVKISINQGADFVFTEAYSLPDLSELETYLRKNKHLPGIPSEMQMKVEGIELGKLNIKLLQKIEELTLYCIRQSKELSEQKQRIVSLMNQVKGLSGHK